jgi:hypothetical protein
MKGMEGRNRAVAAVRSRMAELDAQPTRFARDSGVSENTLRDFLAGKTWPIMRTMGRIERALGWPAGRIEAIARGGAIPGANGAEPESENQAADIAETDGPEPQVMTAITGGGLKITVSPAPGYSMSDVMANMAAIMEATARVLDELEGKPNSATGESGQ